MSVRRLPLRSGFASLIGRPNAGKSTLLNALIGEKLAIVSDKPQTTRTTIQGVVNLPDAQIVFIDTPGIHKSTHAVQQAHDGDCANGAGGSRSCCSMWPTRRFRFPRKMSEAVSVLKDLSTPVLLLANKIDQVQDKRKLLPFIEQFKAAP